MLREMLRNSFAMAKRVFQLKPPTEQQMFTWTSESSLAAWRHHSDTDYGGLSTSDFRLSKEKTAIFCGHLSLDLHPDRVTHIRKSGFAGVYSKRGYGVFDLSPFNTIEMRLKGDGRSYLSSLRTENWVDRDMVDDNSWHHPIHTVNGEWKVYKLLIDDYKRTYHGRTLEEMVIMNPDAVVGLGFHVTARTPYGQVQGPGPYRLEIDWIRAVKTKYYGRQ